ncbi:hypothetical protein [Lysobacter sp. CA199]|uniref:hypothetical protein n=1 Tax=Lysobacter sp. CA199 TaxID=3455608 RepID=UPI003F8D8CA1
MPASAATWRVIAWEAGRIAARENNYVSNASTAHFAAESDRPIDALRSRAAATTFF